MRPTLPEIALATGAALCSQALAQQATRRPNQGRMARRTPRASGQRRGQRRPAFGGGAVEAALTSLDGWPTRGQQAGQTG